MVYDVTYYNIICVCAIPVSAPNPIPLTVPKQNLCLMYHQSQKIQLVSLWVSESLFFVIMNSNYDWGGYFTIFRLSSDWFAHRTKNVSSIADATFIYLSNLPHTSRFWLVRQSQILSSCAINRRRKILWKYKKIRNTHPLNYCNH